jgi:hypothetical protein
MNKRCACLALFSVLAFLPSSARADLDQLCLKNCVASGASSNVCLPQCTYGQTATTTSKTAPNLAPHRILKAPVPVGNTIIMGHKPTPIPPTKDYACLQQCLHDGATYGLCDQRCTKTATTSSGSSANRNAVAH